MAGLGFVTSEIICSICCYVFYIKKLLTFGRHCLSSIRNVTDIYRVLSPCQPGLSTMDFQQSGYRWVLYQEGKNFLPCNMISVGEMLHRSVYLLPAQSKSYCCIAFRRKGKSVSYKWSWNSCLKVFSKMHVDFCWLPSF